MNRPMCKVCNKNLAAANYWSKGVRHYRSKCEICLKANKNVKPAEPKWRKSGYKKKVTCDLCNFKSTYTSQIIVFHVDGNLNNCELINLRSICLCCIEVVKRKQLTWKIGEIEVDR